ncbi:peroxisome assembly protein 12-like, partial [Trichoplusia ni]|uniref:Peroxisome assembly protein 12 n=1 Tax=Trichoplusia ni TaxID=7111 RepID=A0A7E5WWV5_TRINI
YCFQFLAATYPNKCGWCVDWYDELYLLFDGCLQYYYLKHYAASFSESFYGLLRVPVSSSSEFSSGQQLPLHLEKASLALLVLLPYIRDKVEKVVDRWREDNEEGRLGKSRADRARRVAVHSYAVVHTASACARLLVLARYACGARCATPALAALRLALRDAPPREDAGGWGDTLRHAVTGDIGSAVSSLPALGSLALRGAEWGAFCVQLLRWWSARADHQQALPTPPPPKREDQALRWKNKCPLCLQSWKIPTVLPVSGYIFCYICISRHVRAHSSCPVTRCPAAETSLVRLYID